MTFSAECLPTVSVIITAYNHDRYITEALESVLTQDLQPDQIILVDDGSTDNTATLASRFERHGVTIVRRENGGPSVAFNQGAALATCEVLAMFSADDVMTEGSLRMRVNALATGNFDIVCSPAIWIDGNGLLLSDGEHPPLFKETWDLRSAEIFSKLYFSGNFICAPSVTMTRSVWNVIGPLDPYLLQLQDYALWLKASGLGFRFKSVAEPCVRYRWHGCNLSNGNDRRLDVELERVWLDAPRHAKRQILMDVLFGRELANLELTMTVEDLAMLVKAKHERPIIRQSGRSEIYTAFLNQVHAARIINSVF